jgi:hypothetical protein
MHFLSRLLRIHRETGPFDQINLKVSPEIAQLLSQYKLKYAWLVNKALKSSLVRTYRWASPIVSAYFSMYLKRRTPRPTHSFLLILLERPSSSSSSLPLHYFLALHRRCQVEIEDFTWRLSEETREKLIEQTKQSNQINQVEMKQLEVKQENEEENKQLETLQEDKENTSEGANERENTSKPFISPDPTGPPPPGLSDSAIVDSIYHIHPHVYSIVPQLTFDRFVWALQEQFLYPLTEYQILHNNCKSFVRVLATFFFGTIPQSWEITM